MTSERGADSPHAHFRIVLEIVPVRQTSADKHVHQCDAAIHALLIAVVYRDRLVAHAAEISLREREALRDGAADAKNWWLDSRIRRAHRECQD